MNNASGENLVQHEGIPYDGVPSLEMNLEVGQEVAELTGQPVPSLSTPTAESNAEELETEDDSTTEVSADFKKIAEKLHLQTIETIAEKFDDLSHGKITKEEMKQWLDKKDFHEKANKSRRLKETYREFMRAFDTPVVTPSEPTANIDEVVARAVANALAQQKQQEGQQIFSSSLKSFAESKGLKGDAFTVFQKTAEALKPVHSHLNESQIFAMAYNATNPTKGMGVTIPSGVGGVSQPKDEVDLTQGATFITIPFRKE